MAVSKPLLGYLKIPGLRHPFRFVFAYLEVDFDEKVYVLTPELTYDDWYADKEMLGLDFPKLPYLFDGDTRIAEARAILKYLCRTRKPELLGKTAQIQTRIDMVDNFVYELWYIEFCERLCGLTEEWRKKYKAIEVVRLYRLSKFMGESDWITGNDITYVDFFLYEVLYQFKKFYPICLEKFPNLDGFLTRFENLAKIKEHMKSPDYLQGPCINVI